MNKVEISDEIFIDQIPTHIRAFKSGSSRLFKPFLPFHQIESGCLYMSTHSVIIPFTRTRNL